LKWGGRGFSVEKRRLTAPTLRSAGRRAAASGDQQQESEESGCEAHVAEA